MAMRARLVRRVTLARARWRRRWRPACRSSRPSAARPQASARLQASARSRCGVWGGVGGAVLLCGAGRPRAHQGGRGHPGGRRGHAAGWCCRCCFLRCAPSLGRAPLMWGRACKARAASVHVLAAHGARWARWAHQAHMVAAHWARQVVQQHMWCKCDCWRARSKEPVPASGCSQCRGAEAPGNAQWAKQCAAMLVYPRHRVTCGPSSVMWYCGHCCGHAGSWGILHSPASLCWTWTAFWTRAVCAWPAQDPAAGAVKGKGEEGEEEEAWGSDDDEAEEDKEKAALEALVGGGGVARGSWSWRHASLVHTWRLCQVATLSAAKVSAWRREHAQQVGRWAQSHGACHERWRAVMICVRARAGGHVLSQYAAVCAHAALHTRRWRRVRRATRVRSRRRRRRRRRGARRTKLSTACYESI